LADDWVDQAPEEVPLQISTEGYASLTDMLDRALAQHADKTACVSFGVSITYADLDACSRRFATWLQLQNRPQGESHRID